MPKVLLVEDDNNLREIYEARLQAEGYEIVSAKDGEEALVVAKEAKPDLIISDVMMPKISGFEMLDILRNTPGLKDTKVIMLTALGQAEDQSRADRLGADRYLVKSQVTLEDIVKVSHDLLNGTTDEQPAATPAVTETAAPLQDSIPASAPPQPDPPVPAPQPVSDATPPTQPAEPAVAPEPAIPVAQAPTPVPAPTETTQPEAASQTIPVVEPETPSTDPVPTINVGGDGPLAQTEAEETAEMDQKINEFLAQPQDPAASAPAPAPTGNDTSNQTVNDQTLANAVNDLVDNSQPDPVIPPPTNIPVNDALPANVPMPGGINGKKVIQPLGEPPSKSLNDLIKEEEGNSSNNSPQQPPTPPANSFDPSDPNNIAI
jgi:CheY-like chemotaxis protein